MLLVSWLRMNLTIVDPFQTGISQYRTDNTKVVKHSRAKSRQLRRLNRYESFFGRDQCTISRLSITSWFLRESLRHSHFPFMWLVCSTDRKHNRTTNTIERNVVRMWGGASRDRLHIWFGKKAFTLSCMNVERLACKLFRLWDLMVLAIVGFLCEI